MDTVENFDSVTNIQNMSVLIIEDDKKLRFNLERMITALGYKLQGSYSSASEYYKEILDDLKSTNLILLDINLPGEFNGIEFARRIRPDFEVPILYITGNVEDETFLKASHSHIFGYLPKPFTKVHLEFSMKMAILRFNFELEARKHYKMMREKEKLIQIGEFAGGFVHDLNNFNALVMTSIDMINSTAKVHNDEPFPKICEYAHKGRLGSVKIKQLSDHYRRIILNQRDTEVESVNLCKLVEDVGRFSDYKLKKNNIAFICEGVKNLIIETKEIILLQSIVNLISNSIFEIADKNPSERWVKVHISEVGEKILIEVSDSGPGVDPAIIDDIFEFGFSTKEASLEEGSGVGLSFVRSSVEKELHGSIQLKSDAAHTTFQIELPKTA